MGTDRFDTLFLDRDGVINRLRPKDYVKTWEEFEFIPGSVEAAVSAAAPISRVRLENSVFMIHLAIAHTGSL